MCIFGETICNACFLCHALEFFMTSNGDCQAAKTAGFSHAGSLLVEELAAPPETGLPARTQHPSTGDRRANSGPATLAGELTRFVCCQRTPRARSDRSRP